jgi:hypothetical protein
MLNLLQHLYEINELEDPEIVDPEIDSGSGSG